MPVLFLIEPAGLGLPHRTGLGYAQERPGRGLEGPSEQNRGHCWRQSRAPILESSKPVPAKARPAPVPVQVPEALDKI